MSAQQRNSIGKGQIVRPTIFGVWEEYEPRTGDTPNHSDETHILHVTISLSKVA